MPKVGNKHYAYTPAGYAAAKKAAKKSGSKIVTAQPVKENPKFAGRPMKKR